MLNENIRVEAAPTCLLCEAAGETVYENLRDRLFRAPGTWSSRRCLRCGLFWLDPRPTRDDLRALYNSYYTHEEPSPALDRVRSLIKHGVLAGAFGYDELRNGWRPRALGRLFSSVPPVRDRVGMGINYLHGDRRGRLLDVGCGSGHFLHRMKQLGWDVHGIEPDPHAAEIARERCGARVATGELTADTFQEASFDVVTLNHVIEHATNPVELVRAAVGVLKPGGRLVIITPNIGSLGHISYGVSWLPLDPPRHLFLFSQTTLFNCVRRAGLEVGAVHTSARSAAAMWTGSRQIATTGRGSVDIDASLHFHPLSLVFQFREEIACAQGKPVGEELLLTATRGAK
jgi:2-polyprenyl-3-methyl-5-hydroxy-6-metoxy-1,4-benzoquinol methylase